MRAFVLTCCLVGLWAHAATLAHSAGDTIDVSAVRPGMKGYGLSVFRGTQPERFDVEVIDVYHRFMPDQDLILVRTNHPILEKALAVGGMSGSPIFLEGKLAGAYAYGWPFGKDPIVGVTPIKNMMAEMWRPVNPKVWRAIGAWPQAIGGGGKREGGSAAAGADGSPKARPTQLAGLPPYLGENHSDAFEPLRQYARLYPNETDASDARALRPALTPIMYAGLDPTVARLLDVELERFGMVGLQAGGAGRKPAAGAAASPPARFVDGGAIGVELMRGDMAMTAIGTVTRVLGDRLVAFGHPMMGTGQPGFPTCTARILHVLASQQRSFKLGESQTSLGTMIHDRQSAVVIDTALKADTIPVQIQVTGVPQLPRDRWDVELSNHRMMTPMLAFTALANAMNASTSEQSDVTFSARSRVHVQGHGVIETQDVGYSPAGAASPLALGQLRMFQVLEAAYGNPFENTHIDRIEVDLALRYERDTLTIVDALVPSTEVDPGRDLNVYVTLKPFGGPDEIKRITLRVPQSAAGQKLELNFEPGNRVQIERPEPKNLSQLFEIVQLGYPSTSLVVSTKLPAQGLSLRGQVVRGLPASALDTLQLSADSAHPVPFATQIRTEVPVGHVLDGSARVTLDVRTEPLR